jgi:ElaB/YqjD/DUF883 family membrane-anchored ribosome-binding protein
VKETRDSEKQREINEAELAKPLRNRRTNSPAEAKREMERARAGIESTLEAMTTKVTGEVHEVKRQLDVPERIRDKVRSDPWAAVAVAAGVGLGLALLTAAGKRGYDTLTKDEIDEIRAWRKERRRHLHRLETLLEDSATRNARPSLRARIRARLARDGD